VIITCLWTCRPAAVPPEPPSPRQLLGIGSAIAALVAGGMLLGLFVDSRAHTLPAFTLVGLASGLISASYYAYVRFRRFMKN